MHSLLHDGIVSAIAVSCVFHYSVFACLSRVVTHPTKAVETRNRIVSSVHAIICSAAVLMSLALFSEPELWSPASLILGRGISEAYLLYIRLTVSFSVGYFLSDSIIMLRHKSVYSFDAMLHHAIVLPSMLIALATNVSFV